MIILLVLVIVSVVTLVIILSIIFSEKRMYRKYQERLWKDHGVVSEIHVR